MILALYIMTIAIQYAMANESSWLLLVAGLAYIAAEIRYSDLKDRLKKLEDKKDEN